MERHGTVNSLGLASLDNSGWSGVTGKGGGVSGVVLKSSGSWTQGDLGWGECWLGMCY